MAPVTSGTEAQANQQGGLSKEMRECIEICTECHRTCLETVQRCLTMGGKHAAADHVRLLLDCAQICSTSADFMTRGSPLHHLTCGTCAEICRACAESCRQIGGADMQACADICERCAKSCERMSGQSQTH